MRQCDLEQVELGKGIEKAKKTGNKLFAFVDGVTEEMVGAIVELKKLEGVWVVEKVYDQDVKHYEIKRNWHIGGL